MQSGGQEAVGEVKEEGVEEMKKRFHRSI